MTSLSSWAARALALLLLLVLLVSCAALGASWRRHVCARPRCPRQQRAANNSASVAHVRANPASRAGGSGWRGKRPLRWLSPPPGVSAAGESDRYAAVALATAAASISGPSVRHAPGGIGGESGGGGGCEGGGGDWGGERGGDGGEGGGEGGGGEGGDGGGGD
eukprot:scaffold44921_cov66-Phaeocystis_antarctica.AAC.1